MFVVRHHLVSNQKYVSGITSGINTHQFPGTTGDRGPIGREVIYEPSKAKRRVKRLFYSVFTIISQVVHIKHNQ